MKFERYDFVQFIRGPYEGEKGRIWELFDSNRYGVKILTGRDKDQQGTYVANADDMENLALIVGQAITDAHDNYVKAIFRPIGSNPDRFSDDDWKIAMGRAAINAAEALP